MTTWEYDYRCADHPGNLVDMLCELGDDGWEVVSIASNSRIELSDGLGKAEAAFTAFLKRPKEDE